MPTIGNVSVPPVGVGVMNLANPAVYGAAISEEERFQFLDRAVAIGATHFDTADIYGDCEDLLGQWFKRDPTARSKVFLATKFGIAVEGDRMVNGEPEYVKSACEKSLKRMGVDQIDLYYLHRPDPTVPIEKTVGAMAELVKEGKVRFIGLSEVTASSLRRAHAVHPISAVQVEYSPFALVMEHPDVAIKQTCEELGIPMVAYSPIGRGVLTGKLNSLNDLPEGDWRRGIPKFNDENFVKLRKLVDGLKAIGQKHNNASPSQICLAWIIAQGTDKSPVIPIPGTKRIKYLEENHRASTISLSAEDVAEIRKLAEEADRNLKGERYPLNFGGGAIFDTPPL